MHHLFRLILILGSMLPLSARNVADIYGNYCASCHGDQLQGGSAPSLIDDEWTHGSDDESITRIIADGLEAEGMPPFGQVLDAAELRTLVVYLHEQKGRALRQPALPSADQVYHSREHAFRIEILQEDLQEPWSLNWLPDGRILVTERPGRLLLLDKSGGNPQIIADTPDVHASGQGGLLEVTPHPDYANNGWIYLAYSDPMRSGLGRTTSMTKIVRGQINDHRWVEQQTIWQAEPSSYLSGGLHYGCRIAFDQKHFLYFTHGERGRQDHAQDLSRPNGKIHRVHDDGRIPDDNPFLNTPGALPSIWSYGHRNPQGLVFEPSSGLLWETEHGPRGGDELNIVRRKLNYGWPIITYGMNYNGTPITGLTAKEGLEQPATYWTPSPAVCGMDFYTGSLFDQWNGHLFVTALAGQHLRRVVVQNGKVIEQEVLLQDIGRVRDVANGPDGALYLLLNRPGKLVRLVPISE